MKENPYKNPTLPLKFFSENREKYNELVLSEMDSGKYIFSDRYWHSNFAFQGAQGISLEDIAKANRGIIVPDLTLVFESSRIGGNPFRYNEKKENKFPEKFERKVEAYYRSLGYLLPLIIGDRSIRYIVSDKGEEELKEQIEPLIRMYISNKKYS